MATYFTLIFYLKAFSLFFNSSFLKKLLEECFKKLIAVDNQEVFLIIVSYF